LHFQTLACFVTRTTSCHQDTVIGLPADAHASLPAYRQAGFFAGVIYPIYRDKTITALTMDLAKTNPAQTLRCAQGRLPATTHSANRYHAFKKSHPASKNW
jgi:hypothetical protein